MYFIIYINGDQVYAVENTDPKSFENVKMLAGDDIHPPVDGNYRNLKWENLGETRRIVVFKL